MKKQNKGFTLVELLIVIVIIGILAAIIVPSVSSAIEKANLANDQSDVKNMNTIIALEAIERNADYLEALEVQNILKEQGYDLVPQASGYSFWYNTSKNAIELHKTDDMMNAIATASYVNNNVYAAEKGNQDENALEAVIPGQPHMFYIDEGDRALTKVIDGIRNLDEQIDDSDDLASGTNKIKSAFATATGYIDEAIANLTSHFNTFSPDTTLYITDKGFFGGNVTGSMITRDITRVYIPANVKKISSSDEARAILVSGVVIEIPRSVEEVEDRVFDVFTGSTDIVIVVTTDVLTGYGEMPPSVSVKKSSNVSTMKILNVVYTYSDVEDPVPVEFGKKNYLPLKENGEAGKFSIKVTDEIQSLITAESQVEIVNEFDTSTGFTYLKAYIRNKDGTLAAGIVTRYMFVTK